MNIVLDEQYRFVKQLNKEIKASIFEYAGSAYESINKKLRLNRSGDLTRRERDIVIDLDKAFEAVPPLSDSIKTFRGIRSTKFNLCASFVSTSKSRKQALDFVKGGRCCMLNITIVPGSKVLPIDTISDSPSEEEVLLSRDTKFVITNTSYNEEEKLQEYDISTVPKMNIVIEKDTTLSEARKEFSVEEWAERIISLYDEDLLLVSDNIEEAVEFILDSSLKQETARIPKESIALAIKRLERVAS